MLNSKPIDPLEILAHLNWGEGDDLEFKSAKGGLPKSLWETYAAMANSQGGIILLGVEDDGTVSGVQDAPRMVKSLWDTGEHAADITRLLQRLVSMDVLVQEGLGRWTRYRLPRVKDSVHKGSGSVHKDTGSVHKGSGSVYNTEIAPEKWDALLDVASPARENKRLAPKAMERLIMQLCTGTWLTRRELGHLLQRNIDGLRSRFLTSMVEHKRLRLRYPDKPNRADQAYTTVVDSEGGNA